MARKGDRVICGKDGCTTEFEITHHLQKYCPTHRTPPTAARYRYLRETPEQYEVNRWCQRIGCKHKIKGERARNKRVKYCSAECMKKAQYQVQKAERTRKLDGKLQNLEETEFGIHAQRGEVYRKLDTLGYAQSIHDGEVSGVEVSEILGVAPATISKAMDAWEFDRTLKSRNAEWRRPRLTQAMFPTECFGELMEMRHQPEVWDTPEWNERIDHLTRAFAIASRRYFRLQRKRPILKPFHLEIARALIVAMATGGKQMILTPPRHGKSETLIRFVVWLIVIDPEIEVMWVCANEGVSKLMLGAVKDYLENHEELLAATLPKGETYKPAWGENKPWTTTEIKTRQNAQVGQKSSTVLALGRTSKILSRDVKLLIVDDLEDYDSTREPAQREYSRQKLGEIGTRKEEWTAWVYIGSRQHPDDIPNYLMEHTEQGWSVIEYAAHDDNCGKDYDDYAAHVDCMLFPEVRSYRWLMEKKAETDLLGIPGAYEMRYQNKPLPETGIVFRMEEIRANALDRSRGLGLEELPVGRLMAGLDPSARGVQAAFLWHYANGVTSMVDMETQEAGGFDGALNVMERWAIDYDLTEWYYEDNSQQIEFFRLDRLKELKRQYGLIVKPHTTGRNKQDPELGISTMAPHYHRGTINLPYGNRAAREKVNVLLRQLELWSTDGIRKRGKTDVKMASWFPWPRLLRLMREHGLPTEITNSHPSNYPRPVTAQWSQRTMQRTRYPRR